MAVLSSPHFIDLVIALTLLEAAALLGYHYRSGRGVRPADWLANLLSGLCLLLALRGALADAGGVWVAVCLLLSLMLHLGDLARRWRR